MPQNIKIYIEYGCLICILVLTRLGLIDNYLMRLIFNAIVLFSNMLKAILSIILYRNKLK